jgi:polar amino acid transport system substrate-binding protein
MFKHVLITLLMIIMGAGVFAGCGQQPSTPATPATPTPTTAGQVAMLGETVFTSHCASCHGADGQGGTAPAVIGARAYLGKYDTAQGLFEYVATDMPAQNPGSLSHQEYLNVVGYLLVQNDYASAGDPFDETRLGDISLK